MARPTTEGRKAAYRRGLHQEALAAWWLRLKGYKILERRYKTPHGEIDLIAKRGLALAFIEIKARSDVDTAAYAITPHQQARIRQAAEHFLAHRPHYATRHNVRFDAIFCVRGRWPLHLKNAWR